MSPTDWNPIRFKRGGASMSHKTTSIQDESGAARPALAAEFDLEQVRQAVRGIRYGEVRVIIQDGVIVQIERVEKQRLR